MVRFWLVSLLGLVLCCPPLLLAHGNEHYQTPGVESLPTGGLEAVLPSPTTAAAQSAGKEPTLDLSPLGLLQVKFDNLHPMAVHLPLVLFGVAPLALFFFIRSRQRPYGWVSFWSLAAGLVGGLVAATLVHPHIQDLSAQAKTVLERHEDFAYLSLSFGLAGLLSLGLGLALNHKNWLYFSLLAQVGAIGCVSLAGHLGAILTHVLL
ncbi:MAG: hypothetical protein A2600_11145 [Candidatus Lambdaproteobacteria bacterium RIFOXYD1_FULL_56_27]|uniref:DUF2231 domain-containing protein n=1 Tax=Candidatus Lambdaproteobacteria bacterium RIFOXYD2_FULL_56_26 TaxID=1817773 RepID=A0A1F6GU41_9PROT|nr:MAG: hypothetical protein A2426_09185 [Candidatus Lambdaproteobacteria bacterium RIFOXYC1_FULL_56_13]OGH01716.1 MAG: hypothetical protein A2557_09070 [Candidatus Lambdaproteobacteria bacterium RIFOXYD2_FULL_56_26]OGH07601.1 MAG: hypothetical protein A2600_11145 [Candidatus Lambdaproteobacteria bacterium RIFOXYD1_FULL_56_27]